MNAMLEIQPVLSRPGHMVDYFGRKLFVPRGHFDEEHLLSGGLPEGHVLDTFKRFVRPGDKVLDVGANIGTHALALSSMVGEAGLVYAIEADVDNVASLRTSLANSRCANVMLLAMAASDHIGLIHALSSAMTNSTFSDRADPREAKVACSLPLDAVIDDDISFIKLDIEGAELLALGGMTKIFERNRPLVLTEFSPKYIENTLGRDRSAELFGFFEERGYGCFYLDPYRVLHRCPDLPAVLAMHAAALDRFGWHHIDIMFAPSERNVEEAASPDVTLEGTRPATSTPPASPHAAASEPEDQLSTLADAVFPKVLERLMREKPWVGES